jgi:hypothetical protein
VKVERKRINIRRIEAISRALGLSDTVAQMAVDIVYRYFGKKRVKRTSAAAALYLASLVCGEPAPSGAIARAFGLKPEVLRLVARLRAKSIGLDLSTEKILEIDVIGWCRLLRIPMDLCELSVEVAKRMMALLREEDVDKIAVASVDALRKFFPTPPVPDFAGPYIRRRAVKILAEVLRSKGKLFTW